MDLSVVNAEQTKNFYQKVIGWQSETVSMNCDGKSYVDFAMSSTNNDESTGNSTSGFATGICHAKGSNDDMPAVWLPYFLVADIEHATEVTIAEGGALVTKMKSMGDDKYIVIKDPSGAQCALYQRNAIK